MQSGQRCGGLGHSWAMDNFWTIAGTSLDHCRTIAGTLLHHYWTIAGPIFEHCWTTRPLLDHKTIDRPLLNLLDHCWKIAGPLLDHGWTRDGPRTSRGRANSARIIHFEVDRYVRGEYKQPHISHITEGERGGGIAWGNRLRHHGC